MNTPRHNIVKRGSPEFFPSHLYLDNRKKELEEEINRLESERKHKIDVYKREFYAEMGRSMTSYWIRERTQVIPWAQYLNIRDFKSVPINLVATNKDGHINNTQSFGQYVSYSKREIKLPDNHFNDKNFNGTYLSSIHENSHSLDDSFNIGEGVYHNNKDYYAKFISPGLMDNPPLREGLKYDKYIDKPTEQRARLMQLRQYLRLSPRKTDYTESDINDFKERIKRKYRNGLIPYYLYDNIMIGFFNRYTNEYILKALNEWL